MSAVAPFITFVTTKINRLTIMEVDMIEIPESDTIANNDDQNSIQIEHTDVTRRSERRKSQTNTDEPKVKRRVKRIPKKLSTDGTVKEVLNYYLDKKVKRLPPSLETIFEEPQNETSLMSARKFKRTLLCYNPVLCIDKNKVKKRSLKAKKVGTFKKLNKKIAMDMLMKKLSVLESGNEDH